MNMQSTATENWFRKIFLEKPYQWYDMALIIYPEEKKNTLNNNNIKAIQKHSITSMQNI